MLFRLFWGGCRKYVSPSWSKVCRLLHTLVWGCKPFATSDPFPKGVDKALIFKITVLLFVKEKNITLTGLPPYINFHKIMVELSIKTDWNIKYTTGWWRCRYEVMTVQYKVMTGSHRSKGFASPPLWLAQTHSLSPRCATIASIKCFSSRMQFGNRELSNQTLSDVFTFMWNK